MSQQREGCIGDRPDGARGSGGLSCRGREQSPKPLATWDRVRSQYSNVPLEKAYSLTRWKRRAIVLVVSQGQIVHLSFPLVLLPALHPQQNIVSSLLDRPVCTADADARHGEPRHRTLICIRGYGFLIVCSQHASRAGRPVQRGAIVRSQQPYILDAHHVHRRLAAHEASNDAAMKVLVRQPPPQRLEGLDEGLQTGFEC